MHFEQSVFDNPKTNKQQNIYIDLVLWKKNLKETLLNLGRGLQSILIVIKVFP